MGRQDFVVGETITPLIQAGDLLIDCSGSVSTGEAARRLREKITSSLTPAA